LNPYSYILNNPLSGTDPTGYFGEFGGGCNFACSDGASGNIFHQPIVGSREWIRKIASVDTKSDDAPTNIEEKPKDKVSGPESSTENPGWFSKAGSAFTGVFKGAYNGIMV